MNYYLFGQRSKVCGPSKVNIFNQLGETSDLLSTRQCLWVESDFSPKVFFFYTTHGDDLILGSHSERITAIHVSNCCYHYYGTFSYKEKNTQYYF